MIMILCQFSAGFTHVEGLLNNYDQAMDPNVIGSVPKMYRQNCHRVA
jgi:hypothetical protein